MKKKVKKIKLKKFKILKSNVVSEHRRFLIPFTASTPLHNHDGYEILIFLSGNGNYFVESESKYLMPGEIVLTAPYAFHCIDVSQSETYDRIFLNIKEPIMKQLCSDQTDLRACFNCIPSNMLNSIQLSEEEIPEYVDLFEKIIYHLNHSEFGNDLIIPALLTQLLVMINKKTINRPVVEFKTPMPKIVSDTIAYINENLQNEITMCALSQSLHHNPDYIGRCFKEITGTSIQQFIISKRLTLAQRYLREGKSASDSCYLSGFSDYSNFSRTFSNHFGVSPKQYQKKVILS